MDKPDILRKADPICLVTSASYDDEVREAMARWSTRLREIITSEKQKVVSLR